MAGKYVVGQPIGVEKAQVDNFFRLSAQLSADRSASKAGSVYAGAPCGARVDAHEMGDLNAQTGFLAHLALGGRRQRFAVFNVSTRQTPHLIIFALRH